MKISKLINIVRGKGNGELDCMYPSHISATFALVKERNSEAYYSMARMNPRDLAEVMEAAFNVGRKVAYDDVLAMLEERQEMERSGNVRRLLAQLKDNGVVFREQSCTPFGYPTYSVYNLPKDVEL